jgi:phage portal protein BeeE
MPLQPSEVAHWYPLPDPVTPEIGMSWVTPAIREIRGDLAATDHKLMFFQNGATPNLVVKGLPATSKTQFDELVDMMEERHAGVKNAYRTLYLTLGADAEVVGADLKQIDFAAVQGKSETRLSVLSRVPASLLGISEGLAGSALNAGNFGAARRSFADTWVFPTLQNLAGSLAPLVGVPRGAEMWFDAADIGLLREDAKDAAEIVQLQASTITSLVNAGFDPDAVLAAVQGLDISQLLGKHTGMLSVQLQPPGTTTDSTGGAAPASGQTNNGRTSR